MSGFESRPQVLDEIDRQIQDGTIEDDAVENVADMLGRPVSDVWAVQDAILCPADENVWEYLAENERIGGVR